MEKFVFEPYMSFEDQVEKRKQKIRDSNWVINKDWALEQIDKNPYVEFDIWYVGDFYKEVFKRHQVENHDIDYGTYYWLLLRGSEKPKFIINGEEW